MGWNAWVQFGTMDRPKLQLAALTPAEAMDVRELAFRISRLWPHLFNGEHERLAKFRSVMRLHMFLELRNWDGHHNGRCLGCM